MVPTVRTVNEVRPERSIAWRADERIAKEGNKKDMMMIVVVIGDNNASLKWAGPQYLSPAGCNNDTLRTSKSRRARWRSETRLADNTTSALKLCGFARRELQDQETQGSEDREGKVLHKPSPPLMPSVFPSAQNVKGGCISAPLDCSQTVSESVLVAWWAGFALYPMGLQHSE
jgi:hypothetical protein